MSSKQHNTNSAGGIGFCELLTIAFIILKLTKVITWSWVWVFAPIWIPLVIVIIGVIIVFITVEISEKRKK